MIDQPFRMSRRGSILVGGSALLHSKTLAMRQGGRPATSMGLCQYCGRYARMAAKKQSIDLFQPEHFFAFAQSLGAGGYQVSFGVLDAARSKSLRDQAQSAGMYVEGIVKAPKNRSDVDRFDAEMKTAAAVGAAAVRSTIFTGRRYEFFDSLEQYKAYDAAALRSLQLAAPIAEKHRVAFAPENHKDHRVDERVAALKKVDSEFVGVCVDTGNNFALLEDPVETAKALAPWAHAVHIKDQAVQLNSTGFLFGDIPLGQGFIDLKKIVAILTTARPQIRFTLELLTRDPLDVPCLEQKYWTTFPDMPAADLARTLRIVRDHQSDQLQYPSKLTLDQQVALEQENLRASIAYAREHLGLVS